jgi:monoamine oxidase
VRGGRIPTFWRAAADETPVMVGWAAGPAVDRLPSDEEGRVRAALDSLARGLLVPRAELAGTLEGWRVFDWQADPLARGAYSFLAPGALDAPVRLAAPIEGTLFFAGEATHTGGACGTVHGAIETGHRAAQALQLASRKSQRAR